MKRHIEKLTALLLALCVLCCACAQEGDEIEQEITKEPFTLTICAGEKQDTLDPARSTCRGGETVFYHLYENLMRWEDDGDGYPTLVCGQAESYTTEIDYAGNATYTFTLRDDILWSDGKAVTAHHFAYAWKRIAAPATGSPYRELMRAISGYDQVQESGDSDLLGVYAVDTKTLVVQLNGCPPYFLEEICAGAYTVPVYPPLISTDSIPAIFNGPYIPTGFTGSSLTLTKNANYYRRDDVTVDAITLIPTSDSKSDYEAFLNGDTDLVENLPQSVLQELLGTSWTAEPVTSTCAVVLNNLQAPFDNADVRAAFRLVIDEQVLVEVLAEVLDPAFRPAVGLVPYGVTDYGMRTIHETVDAQNETDSEPETLPDPNAPIEEPVEEIPVLWDFRAHGQEIVTLGVDDTDYASDCAQAADLLAGAGYAGGSGFPPVEYIFVDTAENKAIAEVLQAVWQDKLGVEVTLCPLDQEAYDLMFIPVTGEEDTLPIAPYQMAAMDLTADYNDAGVLLGRWHSASEDNCAAYSSAAFDILLGAAAEAVSPESYDAYLHDAEAILLQDAPVIPLCYRGTSYRLADDLEGLYRGPNGVYFFTSVTRVPEIVE